MTKTKKAIFLDIDGTLIAHGKTYPAPEVIDQIQLSRKAGHLVFFNTGRSLGNIPSRLTQAAWIDGIVAGGGAQVQLVDSAEEKNRKLKTIYHKWIEPELLRRICAHFFKTGVWCFFEGEENIYALNREEFSLPIVDPLLVEKEDDFLTKYKGVFISKITMKGKTTKEEKQLFGDSFQLIDQRDYHEGLIKGESKSKGMGIVLEATGISRENSIAIGDSANDLDMIRYAGTGIAMGNATDELKAAASYISADVDHYGAAEALKKYAPD
jgi:Cof subfamily protein (haloacid dehalogenase superfamily)